MEYPYELHDKHNAYPLAPEKLKVEDDWLSEYQKKVKLNKSSEVVKLVPNLRNKEKYIVHYRNLQLYVSLGMKLTIHRALIFNQSPWMEPYISLNTEFRKNATNNFEKDLFKLMNNSVFGKNIENLRKRVDVKLVRSWEEEKLRKLIASPSFNRAKIFDDGLAAIHMHKSYLKFDRPIFVGMSVLDLSKTLMYDFYYNKLKMQYGENVELIYTDTDSLLLEIKTDNFYEDMRKNIHEYDTSDYPLSHYLHDKKNKKVLGKMKDECAGGVIKEVICLRPKMYSIVGETRKITKKAKGVKK